MPRLAILADPAKRVDGLCVDGLAYFDTEIDEPGMRDIVNGLILEEMARYPAPDYYAEMRPLPPPIKSQAIQVREWLLSSARDATDC